MGFFRKSIDFMGMGAHREILDKTIGRSLRNEKIKAALSDTAQYLLWACVVLGDRCFPGLRGKRILGTLHIGGLIVLIAASLIPALLILRAGRKLTNFDWVTEHRLSRKTQLVNDTKQSQGEMSHDTGNTDEKEGQAKEGR